MWQKLVAFFLDYIIGKVAAWVVSTYQRFKRREKSEQDAKESVQPLKDAKTAEEIDRATDQALDKL